MVFAIKEFLNAFHTVDKHLKYFFAHSRKMIYFSRFFVCSHLNTFINKMIAFLCETKTLYVPYKQTKERTIYKNVEMRISFKMHLSILWCFTLENWNVLVATRAIYQKITKFAKLLSVSASHSHSYSPSLSLSLVLSLPIITLQGLMPCIALVKLWPAWTTCCQSQALPTTTSIRTLRIRPLVPR